VVLKSILIGVDVRLHIGIVVRRDTSAILQGVSRLYPFAASDFVVYLGAIPVGLDLGWSSCAVLEQSHSDNCFLPKDIDHMDLPNL
jgi:hypothetical protein